MFILPAVKPLVAPPSLEVPLVLKPRAVTIPTESTFVTSSYVNVAPIDTLPEKFAVPNDVIPVALKLRAVISPVVM